MNLKNRTKTKMRKLSLKERLMRRKTHRLPAHVSREEPLDYEVPNIKLSRAFVIVIVLHIVAVGGILAFEVLKPDGRPPARVAADDSRNTKSEPLVPATVPVGVKIGDPRVEGLDHYIVRAGDRIETIAAKHGVTAEAVSTLNGLDKGGRIYPGKALFIPKEEEMTLAHAEEEVSLLNAHSPDGNGFASNPRQTDSVPQSPDVADAQLAENTQNRANGVGIDLPGVSDLPQVPDLVQEEATPEPVPTPRPPVEREPRVVETPTPVPSTPSPVRPVGGTEGGSYVMAKGDTAYGIARRYGVKPADLLRHNNIKDPTSLQIGQELKIPSKR